jgi:hypothetical protein
MIDMKALAGACITRARRLSHKDRNRDLQALAFFEDAAEALANAGLHLESKCVRDAAALHIAPRGFSAVVDFATADRG